MNIVVFEDKLVTQLYPITLSRAAYTIQCGSVCLAEWLGRQNAPVLGLVRDYLEPWQQEEFPRFSRQPSSDEFTLLINARVVPSRSNLETLDALLKSRQPGIVMKGESVAAALVPPKLVDWSALLASDGDSTSDSDRVERILEVVRSGDTSLLPAFEKALTLFRLPSDLIDQHTRCLNDHLNTRIRNGRYDEISDGVFVAGNVELAKWIDFDTKQGPIVVEAGSEIRSFACLRGPVHLGAVSRVNEHSVIKSGVSIGTMSKVGGEIEASVIEAFTNKQHLGYLGHSYLGRWVNLGAGTSTSNLKNTYGTIRIQVGEQQLDTGLQFMGCVIGDYTKSAINTAIFTGKLIGCCSMLYGYVTTNVPSFANYARSFGEITELSTEVMALTQKRVFLRRGIEQQRWHVELLQEMHQLASRGRQLADKPVSL